MNYESYIQQTVSAGVELTQKFFAAHAKRLAEVAIRLAERLRQGKKVFLFGNGGSAADAQHIAAELVGRFSGDRAPRSGLAAIALTTDTSVLTSLANDFGFEEVFARQIQALGKEGDVAIAISTSGNSANVLKGIEAARAKRLWIIGLTGRDGGRMAQQVDENFCVESRATPRVQEIHILIGHLLCDIIDQEFSR